MYELSVKRRFRASHAIVQDGDREPTHSHDWHVRLVVSGRRIDADGLLCDFHWLQQRLDAALAPLADCDLNRVAPFDEINPTAEHLARHLAEAVAAVLPAGLAVASVSVTEAPGCTATYRPGPGAG